MTIEKEQILLLGASGATGLVFLSHIQTLPPGVRPKLTAYVRTRSRLPATIQQDDTIHIVEGNLTDAAALETAMQGATTVISFLGAYVSLTHFLLRTKPTPIADAFPGIFAAMRKHSVKRILALSTPSAFPQPSETLSWKWALYNTLPVLVVPQGKAEMRALRCRFQLRRIWSGQSFAYRIFLPGKRAR